MRHLTISLSKIRRSRKQSLGNGIAYVLRRTFADARTGRSVDYTKKGGLLAAGIAGWEGSPAELAVAASAAERRCDAVEGRTFILGLPHELPVKTMEEMVTVFAERLFMKHGVASVYALHAPDPEGDPRNYHAHVVFTSRRVEDDGRSLGQKTREWDTAPGAQLTEEAREFWCELCNHVLVASGHAADVEHRSFERLGIRRPPTKHVGERMTAVRRHSKRVCREAMPSTVTMQENELRMPRPPAGIRSRLSPPPEVAFESVPEKRMPPPPPSFLSMRGALAPAEKRPVFRPVPEPRNQPHHQLSP